MNIGEAERHSGLPAKTLRYYEDIDLVVPERRENGYRDYAEGDIHRLRFIQRARSLGFSVEDCRALLALWQSRQRSSRDVKGIATAHLETVERKLRELESLRATLAHLIDACNGDHRPDCPIIDDLAGPVADAGRIRSPSTRA